MILHRCFIIDAALVTAPAWPPHPAWIAKFLEVLERLYVCRNYCVAKSDWVELWLEPTICLGAVVSNGTLGD